MSLLLRLLRALFLLEAEEDDGQGLRDQPADDDDGQVGHRFLAKPRYALAAASSHDAFFNASAADLRASC